MQIIQKILTLIAMVLAVFFAGEGQANAQAVQDRMSLIDSLANPRLADASGVMRFDNIRIEAGEMNEDSDPSDYVFRWTNEGVEPLSVTFVQTTCGCAAPSFDRTPVLPGERGSVKVTYHPKGHPGGFNRRIFVYTNLSADKPTAVLELTGYVKSSVLPTDDYPFAMGGLLLKRNEVSFAAEGRQTERIECLNAGDKVLNISVDSKILPAGVLVEPLKIAPGEIADLVLRFDPAKASKLPASAPVFLKGIPLPPTKCMITIKFN